MPPSMSRTFSATPTPEIQTPILEIRMARVDARYSAAPLSRLHASHVLQSLDAIHRTKEVVLGTVTTDVVLHGVARRLCDLPVGWTPQQGSLAGGPVHTISLAEHSEHSKTKEGIYPTSSAFQSINRYGDSYS